MMEAGILAGEKDAGKVQFQQELNRWFESRGVIADLRSHLRHLMVTALQNTQMGVKAADRSSPKAQAVNLLVAEYLFRRRCHYTLSVFTSEVPTLANFNLEAGLNGGKKRPLKNSFQIRQLPFFDSVTNFILDGGLEKLVSKEDEVEEIFDALGMPSPVEELTLLKRKYLEKGNDVSLVELFLQATLKLATKLQIQQNLESHAVEGERVLSKEWSSKIVDVLLCEKMAASQISAVEENIFRITENEMRRIAEEQSRSQMKTLSIREKRIQEYLRKHEDEILQRLMEAEKELATRKEVIEEELTEREKHLTKMAVEWNNKHEEILKLSKRFHIIENENRSYRKRVEELEEENKSLKVQGETQTRRMRDLQEELNLTVRKLKEVTESNAILSERLQVLMDRDAKEAFLRQDSADQTTARGSMEIPLLWPENTVIGARDKQESGRKVKLGESAVKKQSMSRQDEWNLEPGDPTPGAAELVFNSDSSEDEEVASFSSSFAGIMHGIQEKLQLLEEESNRLNQNYLEYKLKCISADSDSESSNNPSKPQSPIEDQSCTTETKLCQTQVEDTFMKIQKLKETKDEKYEFESLVYKKEETSPRKPTAPTPTKRQLQNRDFFLRSRQLVQQFEKQQAEELHTSSSIVDSAPPSSSEELMGSPREPNSKSPASVSVPLKTQSEEKGQQTKPSTEGRKMLVENSNQLIKSDAECLALLEETRIKSPQVSARRPLRQQMLLSESEKEDADEENNAEIDKVQNGSVKSAAGSPRSTSSGTKVSFGKSRSGDGFW